MTAPVGLAIRVLAARLMMDRLARRIQDQAGHATAVLVALVILVRAERGKTVHPFAGDDRRRPQCVTKAHAFEPDGSVRENLAKIITH